MLYGTTAQFLKVFGLAGLDALPPLEDDLAESAARSPVPEEPETE